MTGRERGEGKGVKGREEERGRWKEMRQCERQRGKMGRDEQVEGEEKDKKQTKRWES